MEDTHSVNKNNQPTRLFELGKSNTERQSKWRLLHLLNLYRFTLASIFLTIITLDTETNAFGKHDPSLFASVCGLYFFISIFHAFTIRWEKPAFSSQVYFQIILDIVLLILLMHASGSIQSGLGSLLIVTIAGASILIEKRSAILIAAIASILVLLEQSYIMLYQVPIDISFTQAGVLGTTLFATAFIAQFLVNRIQETEAIAQQRGVDLEKMEVLADYIVQRMQTGIVVVDSSLHIRLINDSAKQLLNIEVGVRYKTLNDLSPELVSQLNTSKLGLEVNNQIIRPTQHAAEVMPRFAKLGNNGTGGTLIFLEDTSALSQQAQQLKLASLGRLTASIAHEIRNPLGAISHAGQLLAESENLDRGEARMVQIITDHSRRMNTIIENVLQLSRRQASMPEEINLYAWLKHFLDEFCHTNNLANDAVELDVSQDIMVIFDPTQLHQILWNLSSNAQRYTTPQSNGIEITLKAYTQPSSPIPVLDIIDYGRGISDEHIENIFEPFFTTDAKGTGLGLYIARELCESNQARLSYLKTADNLSCFRITFADTRRIQTL